MLLFVNEDLKMDTDDIDYLNAQPDGRTVIRTKRLEIRELVRKNASALLTILSENTGQGSVFDNTVPVNDILSDDCPAQLLGAIIAGDITDQYRFFGYGLWGVFCDNKLIGISMLKNGSDSGIAEIGYAILQEYQRQGYMTEAMLAVLEFARDQGFSSVEMRTGRSNSASVSFFNRLKELYCAELKKKQHSDPEKSEKECCLMHTGSDQTADVDSFSFTL